MCCALEIPVDVQAAAENGVCVLVLVEGRERGREGERKRGMERKRETSLGRDKK